MRLKTTLRTLRIKIGKWFLDRKSPTKDAIIFPPKSILFLRYDGKIGDYVVSSFVFREIKKQSPQTKIGVVCSPKNAYLFENNPYIDQLYFVKTKNIADYLKCGNVLAKEHYEVLIDPTITLRNRDLLFLRTIRAKHYVGYQKAHYQLFQFNVEASQAHISDVYRQALEMVGFRDISTHYDVPESALSEQAVKFFLETQKLTDYVAVNFFGAGSARRFSDEAMKALLDHLTSNTTQVVLLTFPDVTPKLQALAKNYQNVYVYEQTKTVFDTIALIKYAKAVVSPDTSIVHIASGFQKPLVAFYSNDAENFTHWQPNNRANTHILRFEKSVNEIDFSAISPAWLE